MQRDPAAGHHHSDLPGPSLAPAQSRAEVDQQETGGGGGRPGGEDAGHRQQPGQLAEPAVGGGQDHGQHVVQTGQLDQPGDGGAGQRGLGPPRLGGPVGLRRQLRHGGIVCPWAWGQPKAFCVLAVSPGRLRR
ncbi:hypothetical protein GCM10020358_61820 [Amorphoplanes nipponensis]